MKVLIVSQYFWPENFRINEVAQSLRQSGCDVTVLTGQPNYPDGKTFAGYKSWKAGKSEHDGLSIYRVPLAPRGKASAFRLAANYLSFIVFGSLLGPLLLRKEEFDVIFVFGMSPIMQAIPGIVLKRLRGKPLVTWVQDLWPESLQVTGHVRNERILNLFRAVVHWIYRECDLLLVQSNAFIQKIGPNAGDTPVAYHPNPGDAEPVVVDASIPPALALEHGFNIVFAGNLGSFQAIDTILDAAELLRGRADVRFVLIGSGSRSAWLKQQIVARELGNVRLPGRFAPADLPPILAQASALIVSLSRNPIISLTIPSKLQTYLATGRPIICAIDGEAARIVREADAGVSCGAEDASALADAVLKLYAATPEERRRMGENGRRYHAEHFSPPILTDRLIMHLERCCRTASA
jgi:glycosyltransferase involved in cell wall biosynthesis